MDLHGYQKINQQHSHDSQTIRAIRHQIPGIIHEVRPKNGNQIIDEQNKYIIHGSIRTDRQQIAKIVHEILPKRKSPLIEIQSLDIGLEATRANQEIAEVISEVPPKQKPIY